MPQILDTISRRELFSICGQLLGHYPVAGWLRIACSFIKRMSEGRWKDEIGSKASRMLTDVMQRVQMHDPVGRVWGVEVDSTSAGKVWCDASSLAVACVLEINGHIVEDAAWLRPKHDGTHINLAELDSVLRGINLAVKWHLVSVTVMTDSATVYGWLKSITTDSHRIRTHGMAEMLVRRRLSVIKMLAEEYGLELIVDWVASAFNKADGLTRVKKQWLGDESSPNNDRSICGSVAAASVADLRNSHNQHHLGIDRTWYLAKLKDPTVKRADVASVVNACAKCRSIDPAPVVWEKGNLDVADGWSRLACDITHYNNNHYLTVVDCGPSRFAIWRQVRLEDADSVCNQLLQVFRERGPPSELLCDNSTVFRSRKLQQLCGRWLVRLVFRCAYRPAGNGIVERNHRTIKRMAARTNGDPLDMVFWYNISPKDKTKPESVPALSLHSYQWRPPDEEPVVTPVSSNGGSLAVGDQVYVKPPDARCTSKWPVGTVSRINSSTNVEVHGVPRHVADIRLVCGEEENSSDDTDAAADPNDVPLALRRSPRIRKPPNRFMDDTELYS